MKKFTKFLVAALALALLLGTVFAFTVSAAENNAQSVDNSGTGWLISKNVSYSENIHLLLAIDATKVENPDLLSIKISDAAGNTSEKFFGVEYKADLYGTADEGAVAAYVIHTLGVAAKDIADELTIEIFYGEDKVETTTYSVAEYFFERLYKNEIILATEGADLDRKNLYLASLKYGNAAQKLLAAADPLYIEDAVYVGGVEGASALVDTENLLVLPGNYYNVKSYVDGKFVEIVVAGGEFIVRHPAYVKEVPYSDQISGSTTYDELEAGQLNLVTSKKYSLGVPATDNITEVSMRSESIGNYQGYVKNEGGKTFIRGDKIKGSGSHAIDIFRDTTDTEGSVLVFENRLRYYASTSGSGIYHRVFIGRTDWNGERWFNNTLSQSGVGGFVKYGGKTTAVKVDTWFILRTVIEAPVDGSAKYTVYIGETAETLKEVITGTISVSATSSGTGQYTISSFDQINCETFMFSTGVVGRLDVDYSYASVLDSVNDMPKLAEPPETTPVNGAVAPVNDGTASSWKGTYTFAKELATGEYALVVDDIARSSADDVIGKPDYEEGGDGGQTVIRFNRGEKSDSYVVSTTSKFKMTVASNGANFVTKGNSPCYRLQIYDGSAWKDAIYVYPYTENGRYAFSISGHNGIETNIEFGEWCDIKLVYTYTPATEAVTDETGNVITEAVAASAKAKLIVTDANGVAYEYSWTPKAAATINPANAEMRVSCVPNRPYAGMAYISGLKFSDKE